MKIISMVLLLTGLLTWALTPLLFADDQVASRPSKAAVVSFNAVSYEDHLIECLCNLRNPAGRDYEIHRFVPPPEGTRGPVPDAYAQMATCSSACHQLVQSPS